MASTVVRVRLPLSATAGMTVRLYPEAGGAIANGAGGDTLTQVDGSDPFFYEATVTEALAGNYEWAIVLSGGTHAAFGPGVVNLADDTGPYTLGGIEDTLGASELLVLKSHLDVTFRGTVQTAAGDANTATAFDTDLPTENDDYYGSGDGGMVIAFDSSGAQQRQTRRIVASTTAGSNTRVTLEEALDGIPSDDDVFIVVGRITELM